MKTFAFVAYTPDGKRRKGVVVAENAAGASAELRARGLMPAEVVARAGAAPAGRRGLFGRPRRLDRDLLAVFTRQMAVLLGAGLSADAALDAVQASAGAARLETLAAETKARLLAGEPFSAALAATAGELPAYVTAALRAGEQSGELAAVFQTLADHLEASGAERAQIASALVYPAFVAAVSVVVAFVLMTSVAPEIIGMFEATGRPLPELTQALMAVTGVVEARWPELLAAAAALTLALVVVARVAALRARRDRLLMRLPLVGRLGRMAAEAQYLRTLALVVNSRLPLVEALRSAAAVLRQDRHLAEAQAAAETLRRGASLAAALAQLSFLSPVARQLVQAGEASARLGPMTERAARLAETWSATERKRIAVLLEPMLMIVVGMMVLTIVLAVLLPIFDLQSSIAP
ncbi:MAG: type II secretion system F family protein [Rhodobacteraceae bacterium]|nr:type II secretion system F family protein [Paracoccaceae bacterium]